MVASIQSSEILSAIEKFAIRAISLSVTVPFSLSLSRNVMSLLYAIHDYRIGARL